jgi:hypothetical protein
MLILSTTTFPGTISPEVANKVVEVLSKNPYPEYIKRNYYMKFGGDGITTYTIYDVEKGKEADGLKEIGSRSALFVTSLEGYKCTLEVLYTIEEGFAMISMAAPT